MRTARNISIALVAVLGLLALFGTAEGSEPIEGMISHWEFDEGQGDMAYDSVGDNHGTLIDDLTWTSGIIGGALDFDGDGDYVEVADDDSLTPATTLSVFAWIYPIDITANGIVFKYHAGTNERSWSMGTRNDDKLQITLSSSKTSYVGVQRYSNDVLSNNIWQHVGFVFNGNSQTLDLYINGTNVPTTDVDESVPSSLANNDLALYIGWDVITGYFDGTIDDVRIYDSALSAEEIEQLYEDGLDKYELAVTNIQRAVAEKAEALERIDAALEKEWVAYSALEELLESGDYGDLKKGDIVKTRQNIHSAIQYEQQCQDKLEKSIEKLEDALAMLGWEPPFPVSHWTLDEDSGDIAYDSAGDNDGTIYGAEWTTGIIDGALSFDGDDDYVEMSSSDELKLNLTGAISVWVYPHDLYRHSIVEKRGGSGYGNRNQNYWLTFGSYNQCAVIIGDGYNYAYAAITAEDFSVDNWYHIVGTWNTSNIMIYLNGELKDIQDNTLSYLISSDSYPVRIGYDSRPDCGWSFDGIIDDVRIYDRALSAEEVRLLYYNRLD